MRAIKFRGKTELGSWIYGDLIHYENGEVAILQPFSAYGHEATEIVRRAKVIPETVGQFTGLLDKRGKEIYEGDIVHQFDFDHPDNKYFHKTVSYHDGAFGYWVDEGKDYASFISYAQNYSFNWMSGKSKHIEVIGTIYDKEEPCPT